MAANVTIGLFAPVGIVAVSKTSAVVVGSIAGAVDIGLLVGLVGLVGLEGFPPVGIVVVSKIAGLFVGSIAGVVDIGLLVGLVGLDGLSVGGLIGLLAWSSSVGLGIGGSGITITWSSRSTWPNIDKQYGKTIPLVDQQANEGSIIHRYPEMAS